MWISPAVPLSGSALDDRLDEDAQLLQTCVGAHSHPDDADSQAVVIWKHTERMKRMKKKKMKSVRCDAERRHFLLVTCRMVYQPPLSFKLEQILRLAC